MSRREREKTRQISQISPLLLSDRIRVFFSMRLFRFLRLEREKFVYVFFSCLNSSDERRKQNVKEREREKRNSKRDNDSDKKEDDDE